MVLFCEFTILVYDLTILVRFQIDSTILINRIYDSVVLLVMILQFVILPLEFLSNSRSRF